MIANLTRYLKDARYRCVGFIFSAVGISFALWVTRLPEIKRALGMSDGQLGLALFFVPGGALLAMQVSNRLSRRWGAGTSMNFSLIFLTLSFILPLISTSIPLLCVCLFIAGFFMGLTDVLMNAVASVYEKQHNSEIMSTSHGFFSLGGIIGAPLGSYLLSMQVPAFWQMLVSALFFCLITLLWVMPVTRSVTDESESTDEPLVAFPRGSLLWLAIIGFCIMIGEGSVADWSTVYLDQEVGAKALFTGYGYGAFSLTMTLGRFNGSVLIKRFGALRSVLFGCLIGAAGAVLVVQGTLWLAVAGFAVMGAGFCNVVPVLFSIAGKGTGRSSAYGIASVASAGYFGFLTGPVLIGFIAEWINLSAAFLMVGLLAVIAFFVGLNYRE